MTKNTSNNSGEMPIFGKKPKPQQATPPAPAADTNTPIFSKAPATDANSPIFGKKATPTPTATNSPIFGKQTAPAPTSTTPATAPANAPLFGKKSAKKSRSHRTANSPETAAPTIPGAETDVNTADTPLFGKKSSRKHTPAVTPDPDIGSKHTEITGASFTNAPTENTPDLPISKPMNPKTKKKIIIGIVIALVLILAAVATIIIILIVTHVDYKTAYDKTADIKRELSEATTESSCYYVKTNVDSSYRTEKEYDKFIEKCRTSGEEISNLVTELGDTDAVKKNTEIGEKYDKFKKEFDRTYLASDINDKLELYKTYHKFIVAEDNLDYYGNNSEEAIEKVANILTKSNNKKLKQYGEKWLELRKTVESTHKAYYDADWSAENHSELYKAYSDAYDAYTDFVYDEEIEWDEVAEIDTDLSDTRKALNNLYEAIGKEYDGTK